MAEVVLVLDDCVRRGNRGSSKVTTGMKIKKPGCIVSVKAAMPLDMWVPVSIL